MHLYEGLVSLYAFAHRLSQQIDHSDVCQGEEEGKGKHCAARLAAPLL